MAADRTMKFLLSAIALLLFALLLRPSAFTLTAAQAQTGSPVAQAGDQMVVSGDVVYVLDAGRLSAYHIDTENTQMIRHDKNVPLMLRRVASANVTAP